MGIHLQCVTGADIQPYLEDAARLRLAVFREYPYLYAGSFTDERDYLRRYADSPRSFFVLATDGPRIVGVSTALPMTDADPAFGEPFERLGPDPDRVLYLGESVLDPAYRGMGTGHRFFDHREAYAAKIGLRHTAFCAVDRPANHPQRPADYTPLDAFWSGRGYAKLTTHRATLRWPTVNPTGPATEQGHTLTFWTRTDPRVR